MNIFQRVYRYTTFTRFIIHKTYIFFAVGMHLSLSLANGSGLVFAGYLTLGGLKNMGSIWAERWFQKMFS